MSENNLEIDRLPPPGFPEGEELVTDNDNDGEDFWDNYYTNKKEPPVLKSEAMKALVKRVDDLRLESIMVPTAVPAARLHIFNFLNHKPDASADELEKEITKGQRLSQKEVLYSDPKNPLPTIGIEIEIPKINLDYDKVAILQALKIPNYEEISKDLWEVNPDYSYSAEPQARIIQELASLGALPLDTETGKIDSHDSLSLHVNFGMPDLITDELMHVFKPQIITLNDLLVYAYCSTERVYRRKSASSFAWDHAANSSGKNRINTRTKPTDNSKPIRLELRAGEFRDYPSFRMLTESQALVSLLIAHIKVSEKLPHTFIDACFSDLWKDFEFEALELIKAEEMPANAVDSEPDTVIYKFMETQIKKKSRDLVSNFARKVSQVVRTVLPDETGGYVD